MGKHLNMCCPDAINNFPRLKILRWMGLIFGCLAQSAVASMLVFNVYQNDMKETFNFTQKTVEVHSSLLGGGFGMSFLPGLIFDRFGPTWTAFIGLLLTAPSYILLWSTSIFVSFYSKNSWLIAFYFLFAGTGSVFIFMAVLTTNIKNFPSVNRSKIVGLLGAVYAGSPSIISVIYYHAIQTNESADSFGLVMLVFAIWSCCVGLLCVIFLRLDVQSVQCNSEEKIPLTGREMTDRELKTFDISETENNVKENEEVLLEGISIKELFSEKRYWLILCISGFSSIVAVTYRNHLTVISKSTGLSNFDEFIVIIIPLSDIIASILIGILSDRMKDKVPRCYFLIIACAFFTTCPLLAILWGNVLSVLCVATIFSGLGTGMYWTIFPAVISEMFHVGNLGRNWGIALSLTSLLRWAAQEVFGALYDNETPAGNIYCDSGMKCVRYGLLILVLAGSLSLIFSVILVLKGNKIKCVLCYRQN